MNREEAVKVVGDMLISKFAEVDAIRKRIVVLTSEQEGDPDQLTEAYLEKLKVRLGRAQREAKALELVLS